MSYNSKYTIYIYTVNGQNPAPPGMYKNNPVNNGINYLSTGAGFQNHQQYVICIHT